MSKCDTMMRKLCNDLGEKYSIRTIDFERVIYRDFENEFDVEVRGVHTSSQKKRASVYLWFEKSLIVKAVKNVNRNNIGNVVDDLYEYSKELIKQGLNNRRDILNLNEN